MRDRVNRGTNWSVALSKLRAARHAIDLALDAVSEMAAPIAPQRNDTFDWLCDQYYASAEFKQLDEELTQKPRKRLFNRIGKLPIKTGSKILYGDIALSQWTKQSIRFIRDRVSGPHEEEGRMLQGGTSTANDMLAAIRVLFGWAVEADHMDTNPARDVKYLKDDNPDGYHTWTIEEVIQYEDKHPVGTQERLALGCLLYSGQRASDVIRFGKDSVKLREDVNEAGEQIQTKWLVFTQRKNRNSKPVHMEIPLRPELEALIDATPGAWEREKFLTQKRGKPHGRVSFTKDFGAACVAAGVPGRSHGLRKAAAVRLAELGATEKEIAAITGHQTLQEVTRYTKAANQKKLAAKATAKTQRRTAEA